MVCYHSVYVIVMCVLTVSSCLLYMAHYADFMAMIFGLFAQ